jgi:hypothetical protein
MPVEASDPLIILAPPRCFTTLVCAMLGQHPQLYGLPETHLFTCDTVHEWWATYTGTNRVDGLLRAIAELIFGEQTEATIEQARCWLQQRSTWKTSEVLRVLAAPVCPRLLVEKTPQVTERVESMERVLRDFPRTRFIHLLRHPLGHVRSRLERRVNQFKKLKQPTDLVTVAERFGGDPQMLWYRCHTNILTFLATVPLEQQRRVRGEDLLADPDRHLREIAEWLGLRSDPVAIDAMKHPERSPFACFGPRNARKGGDEKFLRQPALRPHKAMVQSLEGPLPWRKDGAGFAPKVRELAQRFGYMKVKFSCVVDQHPKFAQQALIWASSLLTYGGQEADSLLIHTVDECDPKYQRIFDSWGIETRIIQRFDPRHPYSNKLTQLDSEPLHAADYVVLCDCDLAFCASITSYLTGNSIRACIAALPGLSFGQWKRLFRTAQLGVPPARVKTAFKGAETLPTYCNGGLLILPQAIFQRLREVWPKWNRWLLERLELIKPIFTDQISFAMSCVELGLTIDYLPIELNFHTGVDNPQRLFRATGSMDVHPIVLHYHHHVDEGGFLLPNPIVSVNRQIKKINDLVRLIRETDFDKSSLIQWRQMIHVEGYSEG